MLQGTASGVGKSVLAAGIARLLVRRGLLVRPFKAQNIALNAHVCADGGEIGRAQAVQAAAAGVEPTTAMNPLLLKATGDECQVVLRGRALGAAEAAAFWADREVGWKAITAAYAEVAAGADVVVIEGAGSPAEINLAARDWTNMRLAAHADADVWLVGDIERGGVFAHLRGTLEWLAAEHRARVRGLVINRLRGAAASLAPGIEQLEAACGVPVVGVVPHVEGHGLPDEDGLALEQRERAPGGDGAGDTPGAGGARHVQVVRLPHISNFDEFDAVGEVAFRSLPHELVPPTPDAQAWLVLPGTKATRLDLDWLRRTGWDRALEAFLAAGGHVLGVCGGYQMLGHRIDDPEGIEGAPGHARGLGLLPVDTTFRGDKVTREVRVGPAAGYQIHHGRVRPRTEALGAPLFVVHFGDAATGATFEDGWRQGRVHGTSVHGVVPEALAASAGGIHEPATAEAPRTLEGSLDRWASALEPELERALEAWLAEG